MNNSDDEIIFLLDPDIDKLEFPKKFTKVITKISYYKDAYRTNKAEYIVVVKNRIQDEFKKIGVFIRERQSSEVKHMESYFGRDRLMLEAIFGSEYEITKSLNDIFIATYNVNKAMKNLHLYDDF